MGSKLATQWPKSQWRERMVRAGQAIFSRMDEVQFGKPAAATVADLVKRNGAERAFLMVSGTLNRETDEIEKVRRALGNHCVGTDIRDAASLDKVRAPNPVQSSRVRQISIPTTLSAGEFSPISGVTDERTRVKELFRHPDIVPKAVVLDPVVTRHTPMWLWLSTGIRAVDHCVEGICSKEASPYGDASALHGLSLLARGLPRVKADPNDMEARLDCQLGSWLSMAPLVAGVPMGASHGIGYVLGAVFDIPHGHTSCIMLPSVMRWNKSANAERQALVAAVMGKHGQDAGDVLDEFIRGLGMPRSLSEVK